MLEYAGMELAFIVISGTNVSASVLEAFVEAVDSLVFTVSIQSVVPEKETYVESA